MITGRDELETSNRICISNDLEAYKKRSLQDFKEMQMDKLDGSQEFEDERSAKALKGKKLKNFITPNDSELHELIESQTEENLLTKNENAKEMDQ
jgi:hypothetical protein